MLIAGCATSQDPPKAKTTKTVDQHYREAFDRHYAPLDRWQKVLYEQSQAERKCVELAKTNPTGFSSCLGRLPPMPAPETYLPRDLRKDETLVEYTERKNDEWDEKSCFYKGLLQARYAGEDQRIEDQCKRDLEIKRLRKEVEKLNRQKQR
jgi:hypothetical protein